MVDNPLNVAQAKIEDTVEAAKDLADTATEKAAVYREEAIDAVQTKPLQTLAIAAVIGFVIGAIWKT